MKRIGILLLWMLLSGAAMVARTPARKATPPDVFLITIDTLRADHVRCYGYNRIETPTIDGLAKDGIRFAHAFTPSPVTNTSHTTILTGLLPSTHGVTDFAIPLTATHPTWAELLSAQGYHTAAFIGAVILDSKSLPRPRSRLRVLRQFPRTFESQSPLGTRRAPRDGCRATCRSMADGSSARPTFCLGASLRSP